MANRFFLTLSIVVIVGAASSANAADGHAAAESVSAADALAKLKEGNRHFVEGTPQRPHQDAARRAEVARGQHPFAIVLGCADSRLAPELIFDQGLGDLFVERVAGNVVDEHCLGSIEYAVEHLGANLIVVLGHQNCGAVTAARDVVAGKAQAAAHINSLVDSIKPAVDQTQGKELEATVKANVTNSEKDLRTDKSVLNEKVEAGKLTIVGAYYDLASGQVTFLDEPEKK